MKSTPKPIELTEDETHYLQQKGFRIEEEYNLYTSRFPYLVLGKVPSSDGEQSITYHMSHDYTAGWVNKHPSQNTKEDLLTILEATVAVNGSAQGGLFTIPTGDKIKIFVTDPTWEEIAATLVAKYPINEKAQCETIRQSFEQKLAIPLKSVHPNLSGFEIVDYKGRDIGYSIRTGHDTMDLKKKGTKVRLSFSKLPASTDGDTNVGDISDKSIEKIKGNIENYTDEINFFYEQLQENGIMVDDTSLNYRDFEKNNDGDYFIKLYEKGGQHIYIVFNKDKNIFKKEDFLPALQ